MHKRKWLGSGLLLVTAIVWGFCFVVQRTGMDYVGPFTYGASRFLLGAAALLPLTLLRRPDRETRRRSIRAGVPCGVLLFLGTSLQQAGLQTVSAGKAGFLTALYIVLVPLLGLFLKQKVRARVWISAVLGAVGLYLLCVGEGGAGGMQTGDWLLIAGALMFAMHIQYVDHVAAGADSLVLSCAQYFTVAVDGEADLGCDQRLHADDSLRRPCVDRHRLHAAGCGAEDYAAGSRVGDDVFGIGVRDAVGLAGAGRNAEPARRDRRGGDALRGAAGAAVI